MLTSGFSIKHLVRFAGPDNDIHDAIMAAHQYNAPVILNASGVPGPPGREGGIMARRAMVSVTQDPDHCLAFVTVKRALTRGFPSIMFDGAHLDYERSLRQTAAEVAICRELNVSVERGAGCHRW